MYARAHLYTAPSTSPRCVNILFNVRLLCYYLMWTYGEQFTIHWLAMCHSQAIWRWKVTVLHAVHSPQLPSVPNWILMIIDHLHFYLFTFFFLLPYYYYYFHLRFLNLFCSSAFSFCYKFLQCTRIIFYNIAQKKKKTSPYMRCLLKLDWFYLNWTDLNFGVDWSVLNAKWN